MQKCPQTRLASKATDRVWERQEDVVHEILCRRVIADKTAREATQRCVVLAINFIEGGRIALGHPLFQGWLRRFHYVPLRDGK